MTKRQKVGEQLLKLLWQSNREHKSIEFTSSTKSLHILYRSSASMSPKMTQRIVKVKTKPTY